VLERVVKRSGSFPRQTISGCSRRSGRRRTLDTLQRVAAPTADPTRLIGLRLAGTRVAYLKIIIVDGRDPHPVLIADDALHGGRRHDLSGDPTGTDGWPFVGGGATIPDLGVAWAVDAEGDVAWITTDGKTGVPGTQALGVWRAGLGRRQVDSHAGLSDLALRDGVLRWRRNGTSRVVDLTALPPSLCGALRATVGTLEVDLVRSPDGQGLSACLRSTGRTVTTPYFEFPQDVTDINGPYIVLEWAHVELYFTTFVDLTQGTAEQGGSPNMVVDEHGSRAWTTGGQWVVGDGARTWLAGGLWVQDAQGVRKAADADPGTPWGPLLRDGATVTWPAAGLTATLNP
jgi:hypothetical protein